MSEQMQCRCPRVDGYRIRSQGGCPVHGATDKVVAERRAAEQRSAEGDERACAWADYRKDYGVGSDLVAAAHSAFKAGWDAARGHVTDGVLR